MIKLVLLILGLGFSQQLWASSKEEILDNHEWLHNFATRMIFKQVNQVYVAPLIEDKDYLFAYAAGKECKIDGAEKIKGYFWRHQKQTTENAHRVFMPKNDFQKNLLDDLSTLFLRAAAESMRREFRRRIVIAIKYHKEMKTPICNEAKRLLDELPEQKNKTSNMLEMKSKHSQVYKNSLFGQRLFFYRATYYAPYVMDYLHRSNTQVIDSLVYVETFPELYDNPDKLIEILQNELIRRKFKDKFEKKFIQVTAKADQVSEKSIALYDTYMPGIISSSLAYSKDAARAGLNQLIERFPQYYKASEKHLKSYPVKMAKAYEKLAN